MKILYILPFVPWPLARSNYQRAFFLARELSKKHTVDLICLDSDKQRKDAVISNFKSFCRKVHFIPFEHPKRPPFFWRMADPVPASIQYWGTRKIHQDIRTFISGEQYDAIQFTDLSLWEYVKRIRGGALKIIDRTRIDFWDQKREFQRASFSYCSYLAGIEGLIKMQAYEKRVLQRVDAMFVSSEEDCQFVQKTFNPKTTLTILQNGVDERFFNRERFLPNPESDPTLIFCGTLEHSANIEGLEWYFKEVDPIIRARLPNRKIWIVGLNPGQEIWQLAKADGVSVFPNVPDVRPYYQRAWVNIIPLRTISGTRLKVIESLCLGCPVVSTVAGAQGLKELKDGKDLILANTAQEFAHGIETLILQPERREKFSESGRQAVLDYYTWDKVGKTLLDWYDRKEQHGCP